MSKLLKIIFIILLVITILEIGFYLSVALPKKTQFANKNASQNISSNSSPNNTQLLPPDDAQCQKYNWPIIKNKELADRDLAQLINQIPVNSGRKFRLMDVTKGTVSELQFSYDEDKKVQEATFTLTDPEGNVKNNLFSKTTLQNLRVVDKSGQNTLITSLRNGDTVQKILIEDFLLTTEKDSEPSELLIHIL